MKNSGVSSSSFPIAVVAYNRPQLLERTLASLFEVRGINRDMIVVFIDGNHPGVTQVAQDFKRKIH